jgi:hypothetical protein
MREVRERDVVMRENRHRADGPKDRQKQAGRQRQNRCLVEEEDHDHQQAHDHFIDKYNIIYIYT